MPWVKIPPDKLQHLPLFGYDVLEDQGDFVWYRGPHGRTMIEKAEPRVFLEDDADAMQLGAVEIIKEGEAR